MIDNPVSRVIAGLTAAAALLGGGAALQQERDVVPGGDPAAVIEVIAPASPGNTSALEICKLGNSQLRLTDGGYLITFGLATFKASPDFGPGFPNAIVNGEPVMVSKEVVDCVLRRFRG